MNLSHVVQGLLPVAFLAAGLLGGNLPGADERDATQQAAANSQKSPIGGFARKQSPGFLSEIASEAGSRRRKPALPVDFAGQIKPILKAHCYKCHGPAKQEGGLRLVNKELAFKGGDSGPLLVAGKSGDSELIRRITAEDEVERMPPPDEGIEPLSGGQIRLLKTWVDQGAVWPKDEAADSRVASDHWAFQPISDPHRGFRSPAVSGTRFWKSKRTGQPQAEAGIAGPQPPPVRDRDWIRRPIDNFVLSKLEAANITPSPEADRYTLIKRLYYDLVGLPPTPEEVDAFVANDPLLGDSLAGGDPRSPVERQPEIAAAGGGTASRVVRRSQSELAYEELVDRLLNSPHFGERWGRHWLDKARYADSDGYEKDRPRPNAWRYRDWVIGAVNSDMPFDEFTVEQLAGDLLPAATPMQKLATAFHRQTLTNTEGGTDQEQFRVEAVFDRVITTGTVWLGLTVGCAQCHSHKYDPITQREFYQLFALFNNGDETTTDVDVSEQAVAEYEKALAVHNRKIDDLQANLAAARSRLAESLPEWVEQSQARLESSSADRAEFHPLEIVSVLSNGGATLKQLDDGSVLAEGKSPGDDEYTVLARTNVDAITGIRIEALTDKSLPNRGPGRAKQGNFVLTELRLFAAATEKITGDDRVTLSTGKADFSQKGFPAEAAIDGGDETGWAVSPQQGQPHSAVFTINEPVGFEGETRLKIVLSLKHGSKRTIGRFRITLMTGQDATLEYPDAVLAALAVSEQNRNDDGREALLDCYAARDPSFRGLNVELARLRKRTPKRPVMTVRVLSQRSEDPRTSHLLHRGDFLQPKTEVEPATLAVLHPFEPRDKETLPDRLDLALWLVDADNPLTPRVAVNHIWSYLFGQGLVGTMNDFGTRGEKPKNPELLDWLAREYMRQGWSRKAMIKLIVMSSTYRQSSTHRPALGDVDPQNNLLHRQNRFRVGAEIVRDLHLAACGLLSREVGGPSVFPPMPADVAALSYANNFKWKDSQGSDRYRRGMYTFFKRTALDPNLSAFDCPDSNTTCVERRTSNTPLQALTTLNNTVFVEASQAMGRRILTSPAASDPERLSLAFRLCAIRPPNDAERERLDGLLNEARNWYRQHPDEAKLLVGDYPAEGISTGESAAWVATARIIMNLDEFITRE